MTGLVSARSPIRLKVWGDYACFTRPEMKVERVSYDVLTPSSARGILEAIYWKPQVRWIVERLHVLKPIRFTNLRRNEVASKASAANSTKAMKGTLKGPLAILIEDDRQQRAVGVLGSVGYAARGVAFALVGWFLVTAGLQHDASEARGLDGALVELVRQAYGPPILVVLALGLLLFGAFRIVDAALRRPTEITHA